jgi:hypothetical protein
MWTCIVGTMGEVSIDRTLNWIFLIGMVIFLVSIVTMLLMELDGYVILWLSIVTGSVIGMTGGMMILIRAMEGETSNGTSQ